MPGELLADNEQVLWEFFSGAFQAFSTGKLTAQQVLQLALTWKGTTNEFGWAGVAPALELSLRYRAAYVIGARLAKAELERMKAE